MAGDGETVVKIGSAFLPTKEANHLLELFNKDKSIEVAISAKALDAETLKSLRSEVNFILLKISKNFKIINNFNNLYNMLKINLELDTLRYDT